MFSKNKNVKLKKQKKIHLVFDEAKRRDFLTGFHKRKMERKRKAKEKLEWQLKEEKKRLKAEARQSYRNLVKSYTPVPEVEHLLTEEYEDDNVNVKVMELSTATSEHIGANQPHYESDEAEDVLDDSEVEDEVPGMDCKPSKTETEPIKKEGGKTKAEIKKILKKQATKSVQNSKAFQKKHRIEKHKQRRKSMEHKRIKAKHQKTGKVRKKRNE